MSDIELKPCPFCGGEAKMYDGVFITKGYAYVMCLECKTQTKQVYESVEYCASAKAAELWNERVIE